MVKSKKVIKASLAAALVATAVVPVAVAAEETSATATVAFVVVEFGDQLVKLDTTQYAIQYATGGLDKSQSPKYVVDTNGNIYNAQEYAVQYATGTKVIAEALASLAAANKEVTGLTIVDGKIEDGKIVGDSTPEENSIETFFYNLAA